MKASIFFTAVLLFTAVYFCNAQVVYDQSFKDETFARFKIMLTEAVLERDTGKLFPLLAEQVHVNDHHCSYASKLCFEKMFEDGKAGKLWDEMGRIISYGFSQNTIKENIYRIAEKGETIFQAPSYLRSFKKDDREYLLVLGQNVNIRERPTLDSRIITQASFETLKYTDPKLTCDRSDFHFIDGKQWFKVTLPEGKEGYIREDFVSANIHRELSVKMINGEWKIISFYSPNPTTL